MARTLRASRYCVDVTPASACPPGVLPGVALCAPWALVEPDAPAAGGDPPMEPAGVVADPEGVPVPRCAPDTPGVIDGVLGEPAPPVVALPVVLGAPPAAPAGAAGAPIAPPIAPLAPDGL
jgi:hypothetical protein